jgi:hypothetical protein
MRTNKLEENFRNSKKWKEAEKELDKFNKMIELLKQDRYHLKPNDLSNPYVPWKLYDPFKEESNDYPPFKQIDQIY